MNFWSHQSTNFNDSDKEYLAKYGLKENDAILAEPQHMPIFEEIIKKPVVTLIAGGAAQNAARGAQYILPKDSVVYFGSVGNDTYSKQLRMANDVAGVASNYLVHDDIPTGKCAALINGSNRSLVTDLAAANHYKLEHLKKPENWSIVEQAKFFYVGGFHLTVCPDAINALGKHAAETNKVFSMNLSAPFLPQFFKVPLDASSVYWDYLIGNESEILAYAESHNIESTNIETIAKAIAVLPKANPARERVVIVTQGLGNTIVVTANKFESGAETTTKLYPVHAIDSSSIIDTNGAGDAFAGGFLGALVQGEPVDKCIDVGQWLAALSLRQIGPSFPQPKHTYAI